MLAPSWRHPIIFLLGLSFTKGAYFQSVWRKITIQLEYRAMKYLTTRLTPETKGFLITVTVRKIARQGNVMKSIVNKYKCTTEGGMKLQTTSYRIVNVAVAPMAVIYCNVNELSMGSKMNFLSFKLEVAINLPLSIVRGKIHHWISPLYECYCCTDIFKKEWAPKRRQNIVTICQMNGNYGI